EKKKLILDALSWSPDWASRNWSSTYTYMDKWFHKHIHDESFYTKLLKSYPISPHTILSEVANSSIYNSNFQNLITDTYLRTILYLEVASQYGLNYSPDSIRVPLVEYIDSELLYQVKEFAKFAQTLVQGSRDNKANSTNYIENIAFEFDEVKLPILGIIINKMTRSKLTKKDFLDTVLELRNEKKVKTIRHMLRVYARADKGEVKYIREREKIRKKLKRTQTGNSDSIFIRLNNVLDKLGPILSVAAGAVSSFDNAYLGAAIAGFGFTPLFMSYFNQRRFTLLKDLNKEVNQIAFYNDKLQKIFDSSLRAEDINLPRKLNASQKKYLSRMKKQ